MKFAIALATFAFAAQAQADGFRCVTSDESIALKVYNETQAAEGTRTAAVMVLSNPAVQHGRKTIGVFRSSKTLVNEGASYVATVDRRFTELERAGELIGGTKLGELKHVVVSIDFSYAQPLAAGDEATGTIQLLKRNGESISHDINCVRYLKGE